jgi:hypothetical protein
MAHLGFSSQYVLPELRTKPFIEHRVHRELMVEPDGQLNVHLAFAPGLTTGQSRAMVRDMEREQRRQFQDADRQRQQLLREKQLQAQSAAAASEQSELQLLTRRGVAALRPPENSPQSLAAVHQPFSCRLQLK